MTKEFVENTGCCTEEKITDLHSSYNEDPPIMDVLTNGAINTSDKRSFLYNRGNLTPDQQLKLSCILGKAVAPVYNIRYPRDNRINDCWQAIDDFNNNLITKAQLREKREAAVDAVTEVGGVLAVCMYTINTIDDMAVHQNTLNTFHAANSVVYAAYSTFNQNSYSTYAAGDSAVLATVVIDDINGPNSQLLNQLMIDFVNKN